MFKCIISSLMLTSTSGFILPANVKQVSSNKNLGLNLFDKLFEVSLRKIGNSMIDKSMECKQVLAKQVYVKLPFNIFV